MSKQHILLKKIYHLDEMAQKDSNFLEHNIGNVSKINRKIEQISK